MMLVKTKSGGWRGFLFHSLISFVTFHSRKPRAEWEWVDKYTGMYQSARLNSQTINRAPSCMGLLFKVSVYSAGDNAGPIQGKPWAV